MKRLLLTGAAGRIAAAVRPVLRELAGELVLTDKVEPGRLEPSERFERADLADPGPWQSLATGCDAVLHLGAVADEAAFDLLAGPNLHGAFHVYEAARRAGVRRVVYASSGATVSACERDFPYSALVSGRYDGLTAWPILTHESPVRPAGLYGASKIWGEAIARHYADAHGLSAICLRIGAVTDEDRPTTPRHFAVWCSQRDVAQMIERCVAAPDSVRFDVFFVVSDNKWGYRDLEHARAVVGYAPADRAEDHRRP